MLSLSPNPQKISYDEKPHKLYPYSLTFSVKPSETAQNNNGIVVK